MTKKIPKTRTSLVIAPGDKPVVVIPTMVQHEALDIALAAFAVHAVIRRWTAGFEATRLRP
jgi:hypothetical protein